MADYVETGSVALALTPLGDESRFATTWFIEYNNDTIDFGLNNDCPEAPVYYATATGYVNAGRVKVQGASGSDVNLKLCVYADTGSTAPGALLAVSDPITIPDGSARQERLVTFSTPFLMTNGQRYWVSFLTSGSANAITRYTNTGFSNFAFAGTVSNSYNVPPDPFPPYSYYSGYEFYCFIGSVIEVGVYRDSDTVPLTFTVGRGEEVYEAWFGATAPSGSQLSGTLNNPWGGMLTPNFTGEFTQARVRMGIGGSTTTVKMVAYADNGSGAPGARLGISNTITIPASTTAVQTVTFPTPIPVSIGTPIWLIVSPNTTVCSVYYNSVGAGYSMWNGSNSYASPPDPCPTGSVYATYSIGLQIQAPPQIQGQGSDASTIKLNLTGSGIENFSYNNDFALVPLKFTPITTHECKTRFVLSVEVVGMNNRWTAPNSYSKFNNVKADTKYYVSYVGVDPSVSDC